MTTNQRATANPVEETMILPLMSLRVPAMIDRRAAPVARPRCVSGQRAAGLLNSRLPNSPQSLVDYIFSFARPTHLPSLLIICIGLSEACQPTSVPESQVTIREPQCIVARHATASRTIPMPDDFAPLRSQRDQSRSPVVLTTIAPNPVYPGTEVILRGSGFSSHDSNTVIVDSGGRSHIHSAASRDSGLAIHFTLHSAIKPGKANLQVINGVNEVSNTMTILVEEPMALHPTNDYRLSPAQAIQVDLADIDLSGIWRTPGGDVLRFVDRGDIVEVSLVSSRNFRTASGLMVRRREFLRHGHWHVQFVNDPRRERQWDLPLRGRVIGPNTLEMEGSVKVWDGDGNLRKSFQRETLWRRIF